LKFVPDGRTDGGFTVSAGWAGRWRGRLGLRTETTQQTRTS